ncbi:DUF2442 domain-containing protein [Brevundimonas sp. AJA228-03]|uniref:DUF2442 domain-containing protein n=1 Tax=Brevundimonas sp. AJA228-03 TaxID=2752515 RepID=UPI001AE023BE|nr:DUF2442 domain-containing protein [Brevundimonas sp. AJA228-03]
MTISARTEAGIPMIRNVSFDDARITVEFQDGRAVALPLAWYPRLLDATPAQRDASAFIGDGEGLHWEEIDEDLSAEGLLRGAPAPNWKAA